MNSIGRNQISHEDLQLYFDGELTGAEAQELAAQVEADPQLRRRLEQMGFVRDLVAASLDQKAQEIPQARFEQIWDEIDRTIDWNAQVRETDSASLWTRLRAAWGSLRRPIWVVAGATAVALVIVAGLDGVDANKADEVASVEQPMAEEVTPRPPGPPEPMSTEHAIATAPPLADSEVLFPAPKPAEADIHSIEFGGKNGRIAKTGTVTVLYVEEDIDQDNDSERSL